MQKNCFLLFLLVTLVTLQSCNQYNKVLKSKDLDVKEAAATEYYNKGDYYKALPLLEELISLKRQDPGVEKLYYFYCFSYYGQKQYLFAANSFKNLGARFSNGPYAEESYFMHAKCYYKVSPRVSLEQTYTYKAIDAFQLFINLYPDSKRIPEANAYIDELRRKLELKAVEQAELYFDMERYKAAAAAYRTALDDFPDIDEDELIRFKIVKALYLWANNSYSSKQQDRFEETKMAYDEFRSKYAESQFDKELTGILRTTTEALESL